LQHAGRSHAPIAIINGMMSLIFITRLMLYASMHIALKPGQRDTTVLFWKPTI
jgi:hypothetical protein